MNSKKNVPVFISLILSATIFSSCHKDISNQPDNFLLGIETKVNSWLDKLKSGVVSNSNQTVQVNSTEKKIITSFEVKNNNIDLLKKNLDYANSYHTQAGKKFDYILIPINDEVKTLKHVDKNASLNLVLITDKVGNIVSGNIVCYIPKNGKPKGLAACGIIEDLYKGKLPADSGMIRFLSVTGRWLHQLEFNKGRISSYGIITDKNPKSISSVKPNSDCQAWYLVTTYFYSDGTTISTSDFVGITCNGGGGNDCTNPDYQSLCSDSGGGGGNPAVEDVVTIDEYSETSDDNAYSGSSGPALNGGGLVAPPLELHYRAVKHIEYDWVGPYVYEIDFDPIICTNEVVDYYDSNGNIIERSVYLSSQGHDWIALVQPTCWMQWVANIHAEYACWYATWFAISPLTHVKVG